MAWDDDSPGEEADDGDTTAPCPHCGADIYDDAERCPACGMYLSAEDAPRAGWPAWMKVAAVLALIAAVIVSGLHLAPRLFR
jgi:hypothetical protein